MAPPRELGECGEKSGFPGEIRLRMVLKPCY